MVFIPQRLLKEKLWLKEVTATVDPKAARRIYFQRQAVLEEGTGEPCWGERGAVIALSLIATGLSLAAAYCVISEQNWIGAAAIAVTILGARKLEYLVLRHLAQILYVLLAALVASLLTPEGTWLKLLIAGSLIHFFSFQYAALVTFSMMMRNDRAYRALYPSLRIHFSEKK
jgi:hypothetical protein